DEVGAGARLGPSAVRRGELGEGNGAAVRAYLVRGLGDRGVGARELLRGDDRSGAVHDRAAAVHLAARRVAGQSGAVAGDLGEHVASGGDRLRLERVHLPVRRALVRDDATQVLLQRHVVAHFEERAVLPDELDRPAVPGAAGGAGADDRSEVVVVGVAGGDGELGCREGVDRAGAAVRPRVADPEPVVVRAVDGDVPARVGAGGVARARDLETV